MITLQLYLDRGWKRSTEERGYCLVNIDFITLVGVVRRTTRSDFNGECKDVFPDDVDSG
jgi:hypothetical protein